MIVGAGPCGQPTDGPSSPGESVSKLVPWQRPGSPHHGVVAVSTAEHVMQEQPGRLITG
jgi:hypothetical protein